MDLHLHIVSGVSTAEPEMDFIDVAKQVLTENTYELLALVTLAELVDWERYHSNELSGLGQRCLRALRQRVLVHQRKDLDSVGQESTTWKEVCEAVKAAVPELPAEVYAFCKRA